jgi:hypothetical protein
LGRCLYLQRRYAEAEPLLVEAYDTLLGSVGLGDLNTRIALMLLLDLYRDTARPREALTQLSKASQKKFFPPWSWDTWKLTRFIFDDVGVGLGEAVERLRDGCRGDAASVSALIQAALAERRRVPDRR